MYNWRAGELGFLSLYSLHGMHSCINLHCTFSPPNLGVHSKTPLLLPPLNRRWERVDCPVCHTQQSLSSSLNIQFTNSLSFLLIYFYISTSEKKTVHTLLFITHEIEFVWNVWIAFNINYIRVLMHLEWCACLKQCSLVLDWRRLTWVSSCYAGLCLLLGCSLCSTPRTPQASGEGTNSIRTHSFTGYIQQSGTQLLECGI